MNSHTDSNEEGAELQSVMGDYFDALLHEDEQAHTPSVVVAAVTIPAAAIAVDQHVTEAISPPIVAETVCDDASAAPVGETAPDAQAASTVAVEECAVVPDTVQPAADPAYQLFRIGGLTLGIPTQCIAGIVAAPAQWTACGDARTWILGSHGDPTGNYMVVDTAALLVPGTALQAVARGSHAVLLAGQRWALACDGVGERIAPDPAQVNWRGAQGKRPWLAGTMRSPACALLDIPELLRLLEV